MTIKRHKIVRSDDATTIIVEGDKRNPEPAYAIIKFPGGVVEVTRTANGDYWAHVSVPQDSGLAIVDSRIDYAHAGYVASGGKIPPIPMADHIQHIAIRLEVSE